MAIYYREERGPGCGGCLILVALFILLTGGAPALMKFMGYLFFSGLIGVFLLMAAFWGFSFYLQRRVSEYAASQTETHNRFVFLLIHILVNIAQSDGHFTKAELATMLNFFQNSLRYNSDQMRWVKQLIKNARDADHSMDTLLQEFHDSFAYEPRLILLELIYQILYTKQPVVESELQQARNIAVFLEISAYDLNAIEAKYRYRQQQAAASTARSDADSYAVLGLEPGSGFTAIKSAYRKLSMQYHPDKVAHLGDEFKAVAEAKMKEINAAYDHLKKQLGEP